MNAASRPCSGRSRIRSVNERPQPIQTAPITVAEIDAVAACRVAEMPLSAKASSERRHRAADHPRDVTELGADEREDPADVPGRRERAERSREQPELVQRNSGREGDQREQPPAAEVDRAEHDRQRYRHDEQARGGVAQDIPRCGSGESGGADLTNGRRTVAGAVRTPRERCAGRARRSPARAGRRTRARRRRAARA